MHRIDVPSATVDHLFTEGSPSGGVPATTVSADWLNDLQETVCKAIEMAGITLVKDDVTQLYDAMVAVASAGFLASLGLGGGSATDYIKIPFRDKTTGLRRELIIQWGNINAAGATSGTVTFPIVFPANCRVIVPSDLKDAPTLTAVSFGASAATNCPWYGVNTATGAAMDPGVFQYIAIGI